MRANMNLEKPRDSDWADPAPFNRNADKLMDEAKYLREGLSRAVGVAVGHYEGDGAESRFINLGFTPVAVLVMEESGQTIGGDKIRRGGLAVTGYPARLTRRDTYSGELKVNLPVVEIKPNGFSVYSKTVAFSSSNYTAKSNYDGEHYHYIAVRGELLT